MDIATVIRTAIPLVKMLIEIAPGAQNLFRQVINGGDVSDAQIEAAIAEIQADVRARSERIQAAGGSDGK